MLSEVVTQRSKEAAFRYCATIANQTAKPFSPCYCYIHALFVGEEADCLMCVRPHHRDDDHFLLTTLEAVHGGNLNPFVKCLAYVQELELFSDLATLRTIGRNDTNGFLWGSNCYEFFNHLDHEVYLSKIELRLVLPHFLVHLLVH